MAEESILSKVQKLVDKAWSTQFEAEKVALLAKADELMVKYSIEQFELLDPSRPATAPSVKLAKPEVREIFYYGEGKTGINSGYDSEVRSTMAMLFNALAVHNNTRIGYYGWDKSKVVGYPADLDFLEMMFLSLKIHMLSNLSPTLDPDLPWETNVARFKNVGFKWEDIHLKLRDHPKYPMRLDEFSKPVGLRMYSAYKKWCEVHMDEDQQRVKANPKQWREGFVNGYVQEIRNRLNQMRRTTIENNPNLPDVLSSMKKPLDEFFYEQFPEMRPQPVTASRSRTPVRSRTYRERSINYDAMTAGKKVAKTADLSGSNGRISNNPKGSIG